MKPSTTAARIDVSERVARRALYIASGQPAWFTHEDGYTTTDIEAALTYLRRASKPRQSGKRSSRKAKP